MGDSIDPIESLLTWPSLGSGNHSEPTKRFDKWIKSLASTVKSIRDRVTELERQNAEKSRVIEELKARISSAKERRAETSGKSFAQIAV